jgi:CO/xanthine dehydrogenase FAD-binding subunit
MDLISVAAVRVARSRADLALATGERALGGGTWLYSEPQPGLTGLVDLTGLGWDTVTRSGSHLTIGATCTIATVRELPDSPLFRQCADALLASWKIQRIATIGGNIALSLPAGPMISLAVALDARLALWSPTGERTVRAADFVTAVRENLLEPGEVIRSIEIPLHLPRTAFRRIALSPLGRTGTLVIGRVDDAGSIQLTVTGGTARPHSFPASGLDAAFDSIVDWYDDPHGSPDWRRAMSLRFAREITLELAEGPA